MKDATNVHPIKIQKVHMNKTQQITKLYPIQVKNKVHIHVQLNRYLFKRKSAGEQNYALVHVDFDCVEYGL